MWPFSLFRKQRSDLYPEKLWTLGIDGTGITGTDNTGTAMFVAVDGLRTVAIETNDSGPWGTDLYWMLFGADGKLGLAFPQGATGEEQVLDYLMKLPGFDHGKMIEAMGCTTNAVFVVWEKPQE